MLAFLMASLKPVSLLSYKNPELAYESFYDLNRYWQPTESA